MAKKRELLTCINVRINGKICVYQEEDGYFGRSYQSESCKIGQEWVFDAYKCLDPYFLYQSGGVWFCLRPETTDVLYLGKEMAATFYVSEKEDGTQHYVYFNLEAEYFLREDDALFVEEGWFFPSYEHFIVVFEKKDFCKIFYLADGEIWCDPVNAESIVSCGYLSILVGKNKTRHTFFRDQEEGYHLLHRGDDLSHFHNAFVEMEGDKFILYLYDGKDLVAIEEETHFLQSAIGLVLGDKFWGRRPDAVDLLYLEACQPPESMLEKQAEEVVPDSEEKISSVEEKQEGLSFWCRLQRWLGFGK